LNNPDAVFQGRSNRRSPKFANKKNSIFRVCFTYVTTMEIQDCKKKHCGGALCHQKLIGIGPDPSYVLSRNFSKTPENEWWRWPE